MILSNNVVSQNQATFLPIVKVSNSGINNGKQARADMTFAKIHEAVHVCSLVGEQKCVQRFVALENVEMHREEPLLGFVDGKQLFDRLFLPAKKAEIETVRNRKCDECCVQQKDSDIYEKSYNLCDVHTF